MTAVAATLGGSLVSAVVVGVATIALIGVPTRFHGWLVESLIGASALAAITFLIDRRARRKERSI